MLDRYRALKPSHRGLTTGLAYVVATWLAIAVGTAFVPPPSSQFFGDIAQIGATLLVAFAVEVSWLVKVSDHRGKRRQEWIGEMAASGLAGLGGIAIALALAEHLAAGHRNWLDHLGFAWVLASMALLGVGVALQPLLTDSWRRAEERSRDPLR